MPLTVSGRRWPGPTCGGRPFATLKRGAVGWPPGSMRIGSPVWKNLSRTPTPPAHRCWQRTDWEAFEQRHEILRVLERLPLRQRQVMTWTYDGCTPTEIAEALTMTPEAVRSSLKKARTNLKMFLTGEGG